MITGHTHTNFYQMTDTKAINHHWPLVDNYSTNLLPQPGTTLKGGGTLCRCKGIQVSLSVVYTMILLQIVTCPELHPWYQFPPGKHMCHHLGLSPNFIFTFTSIYSIPTGKSNFHYSCQAKLSFILPPLTATPSPTIYSFPPRNPPPPPPPPPPHTHLPQSSLSLHP